MTHRCCDCGSDNCCCPGPSIKEKDHDIKVIEINRCSSRCLSSVFGKREMLICPNMTSADLLVKIPRKMLDHKSSIHKSNLDFFTEIKGVKVTEQSQVRLN